MEKVEKVREWLTVSSGYGDGYGSGCGCGSGYGDGCGSGYGYGYGYGSGCGDGSGYGSGSGCGDGSGSGSGSGCGDGSGLKSLNGDTIYIVDGVQTIIKRIVMNLAKGFIVNNDLTLTPCYVVKGDGYFAHGKTRKEAQEALQAKIFENMDSEEAIEKFLAAFEKGKLYSGKDFFEWHHYLTGSCQMGRETFVRDKGLNLDDTFTVDEFIALCENSYGGEIIEQLKERYYGR